MVEFIQNYWILKNPLKNPEEKIYETYATYICIYTYV